MSNLFSSLKTEGLEESQDRLGGGFGARESDIATGTIKAFYAGKSKGGAASITIIGAMEDGKEYRETLYVTNKKGENFFLNAQDKTKKVPLPGFTIAEDICLVTVGKSLAEIEFEEKTINIYDYDAKKELATAVPMAVELIGQQVSLGILKQLENKSVQQGDEYVATAETREINVIDKVFHTESKRTVVEARQGAEKAAFWDGWLERNKGQTRDKRTIKDGEGVVSGKPGAKAGTPPAAGTSAAPKKNLFNK